MPPTFSHRWSRACAEQYPPMTSLVDVASRSAATYRPTSDLSYSSTLHLRGVGPAPAPHTARTRKAKGADMYQNDERMRAAAELTARQLEQAIEIVEDQFGSDLEHKQAPVVAAVLSTLAANYREGSVSERRRLRSVQSR